MSVWGSCPPCPPPVLPLSSLSSPCPPCHNEDWGKRGRRQGSITSEGSRVSFSHLLCIHKSKVLNTVRYSLILSSVCFSFSTSLPSHPSVGVVWFLYRCIFKRFVPVLVLCFPRDTTRVFNPPRLQAAFNPTFSKSLQKLDAVDRLNIFFTRPGSCFETAFFSMISMISLYLIIFGFSLLTNSRFQPKKNSSTKKSGCLYLLGVVHSLFVATGNNRLILL